MSVTMGCAISKVRSRIIDSSKLTSSIDIQIVDNANLTNYFTDENNPNPKCIFIFGGSGSNKGEFIWQLLQQREISDNDLTLYSYEYIDVEKLIVENIGKRIKKLTTEKLTTETPQKSSASSQSRNGSRSREMTPSDASIKTDSSEDLKTKMLVYANVVSNSWVLGLISKEIDKHSIHALREPVFLVNLIPNRINVFRNCLYLKQAPSFINFHYNYIALNLIKSNSRRKDLDQLASNSCYDEVISNFINYFRLINKLVEIKVDYNYAKIKIKITEKNNKNAIQIASHQDIISFIYCPKKDGMEIDISQFQNDDEQFQNSLLFVIKNEIDIDNSNVLVFDEDEVKFNSVRKFVQVYMKKVEMLKE